METAILLGIFSMGAIIGSFLNVLIYRLPSGKSILFPASHCPECHKPVRARDNIPIISYLLLGGHCRNCQYPIPYRYIIVEIVSASLWALLYLKFGLSVNFILFTLLTSILIICTYTDIDHYRILNSVIIAGFIIALFLILLLNSGFFPQSVYGMVTGMAVMSFWAVIGKLLFKKTALGAGDIKLIALIGVFTGPKNILLIIFFAFFIASLIGIILGFRYGKLKDLRLPLAPFISVASFLIILFGNQIIQGYLGVIK